MSHPTIETKRNWLETSIKWLLLTDLHPDAPIIDTPVAEEYHEPPKYSYIDYHDPDKIKVGKRKLVICDQSRRSAEIFIGYDHINPKIKYIYIIIEEQLLNPYDKTILPHEQLVIKNDKTFLRSTYFEYYDQYASFGENDTKSAGFYLSTHDELDKYAFDPDMIDKYTPSDFKQTPTEYYSKEAIDKYELLADKVDIYFYSHDGPSAGEISLIYHSSSDNIEHFCQLFSAIIEKYEDYNENMVEWLDKSTKWLWQTDIHPSVDLTEAPIALEENRGNDYYQDLYDDSKIKISRRKLVISRGLYQTSLFIGFIDSDMDERYLFIVELRPKKILESYIDGNEQSYRKLVKINEDTFVQSTYFQQIQERTARNDDYEGPWMASNYNNTVYWGKGPVYVNLYTYDENLDNQKKLDDNRSLIFHGSSDNIKHFIESFHILTKSK